MHTLTDTQALEFLEKLFPNGLADPALLATTCPDGWENSPLRLAFHPGDEQRYAEHVSFLKNLSRLRLGKRSAMGARRTWRNKLNINHSSNFSPPEPIPTFDEFLKKYPTTGEKPNPIEEWVELLGLCLWDILSDNHNLILPDDSEINFGSFRTAGALIDDFASGDLPSTGRMDSYGYMRFYMGTAMISGRTDLRPVYKLIFTRLKSINCRWRHSFPELHLIDFSHLKETKPEDYNPSQALAEETEQKKKQAELRRMRQRIAKDTATAKSAAMDQAPPATVQAYQTIYQTDPLGWPP